MSNRLRLASVVILALVTVGGTGTGQTQKSDVFALLRALDEPAARGPVWPGFRLSDWPVAIFDGTQTVLVRHPSPPPGFTPLADRPGVFVFPGRFPAVAGNSTADIGGVRTGTVIATAGAALYAGGGAEQALLACIEEMFHLFWLGRHRQLRPNEMARYAYPVKDRRNLQRLLAEDEALARALETGETSQAAAWAAKALQVRRERNDLLSEDARAFETGLEMMEGTANYVAREMVGLKAVETTRRLREERAADQIRWRYYDSGTAICLLLDRLLPDWKTRLDNEPGQTTIALLGGAIGRGGAKTAVFTGAELAAFDHRAAAAIAELSARQTSVSEGIRRRSGPRVVVEVASGAERLRVARFDPINLLVLAAGQVVHPRYLTLSAAGGTIEVTNPAYNRGSYGGIIALTQAAGGHPLADGIVSVSVVGLHDRPKIDRRNGELSIETEGLRIALRNAGIRTDGETLRITVGK